VLEYYVSVQGAPPKDDAVKVRHILYGPDSAGTGTVPEDDPGWAVAEGRAKATYELLKTDINRFDEIARRESIEPSARTTGGKLLYLDPSSGIDQAFADAIFKEGLRDGQLLAPVRSAFGWHVIQIMYRPPTLEQFQELKNQIDSGADAAQIARDFSEAPTARDGGNLGWITRGQLYDERLTTAIFDAQIGKTTDVVTIDGDGLYFYKVLSEEVRDLDRDQEAVIRNTAFQVWYQEKSADAVVEVSDAFSTVDGQ
jgi:parvulin-like peptidyl-prolyl isomerase